MIVGVLTTCHTQYTWDSSICIFLFNPLSAKLNPISHLLALLGAHHILHVSRIRVNRTTLQVFVTYLTGALYVHHLWFYKHQHENRVRSKLNVFLTMHQYHMLHVHNCILLKMGTWGSKHVKENTILRINDNHCIKLVVNIQYIVIYYIIIYYTGCHRRNGPNFGRVFLVVNYTDITQNTYAPSWTVIEIMAK
jgi:hypothetical protein